METKWVTCPFDMRFDAIRWETVKSDVDEETDGKLVARNVDGVTKWSPVSYGTFQDLTKTDASEFATAFDSVTGEATHQVSFDLDAVSGSLYDTAEDEESEELGPFERLLRGEDVPEEELPMESLTSDEPVMDDDELEDHVTTADLDNEDDEEFDDLFEP